MELDRYRGRVIVWVGEHQSVALQCQHGDIAICQDEETHQFYCAWVEKDDQTIGSFETSFARLDDVLGEAYQIIDHQAPAHND